ncbi:hypothetical protein INT43_008373 [Umbelopsis isabellina]|uniref:Uncharacterized protein n=1 Tax=Mortierella isabellina TaxID=91625 RepID=A0A8H7PD14_MORIS|nr:hypothetical protein INT43_008373 [Umbelopsis isabellina]
MKLSLLLVALIPAVLVSAGPLQARGDDDADSKGWDGNAKCDVKGFKISFQKVTDCCLKKNGGSWFHDDTLTCTLPIRKEGPFRKCVKDLGFATAVDCDY